MIAEATKSTTAVWLASGDSNYITGTTCSSTAT